MRDRRMTARAWSRRLRIGGGGLMALVGALVLAGLFYVADSHSPFAERMLFVIGMAQSLLLSAIAQTLVLVGLWLVWTGARRSRPRSV